MDKIIANFTTQDTSDFPLDCETLECMAHNAAMAEIIGNAIGDKCILYGCTLRASSLKRDEGYVFLRTRDYPMGEVLRFAGGIANTQMHLVKKKVGITSQGYTYNEAYTERFLAVGKGTDGEETYNWADFTPCQDLKILPSEISKIKSELALYKLTNNNAIKSLEKELRVEMDEAHAAMRKEVDEKDNEVLAEMVRREEPAGIVKLFAGDADEVPDGYVLCDGRPLEQAAYPKLYAVIGHKYDNAPGAGGILAYPSPAEGKFRVPDLRGRFIVGYNDTDSDYEVVGKTGGEKSHLLTSLETAVPPHTHDVTCSEDGEHRHRIYTSGGNASGGRQELGEEATDDPNNPYYSGWAGMHTHTITIGDPLSVQPAVPHENRPPYYTLAYIIKAA